MKNINITIREILNKRSFETFNYAPMTYSIYNSELVIRFVPTKPTLKNVAELAGRVEIYLAGEWKTLISILSLDAVILSHAQYVYLLKTLKDLIYQDIMIIDIDIIINDILN